ncbi:DUF5107 domain-containing protein [Microbacterium sp. TNHR37B]|uniref:DUF5107 domain-containing protein n=1 Tax=Microbacterium sp. TNHR37B TaxID=1775956 RepID=UPI0007B308EC|nr:DUF5107 domain-containing protein [Microbacterium sp. TNHR37B]KZE91543.1 hypothetical protein AVP41_01086 [Microbacterium sp. TNHR37B]
MTRDDTTPSRIILPEPPADQAAVLAEGGVACWSEPLSIDTYAPGEPDPYPLFLDRRVYQGSSGKLYPLPMTDRISHEKEARLWQAIHLENAYVRLVLLPEIGGRIHIGYDKVAGYDFFYRNNVIKPALVGLAGPWMSGGVEFNWPQHHRPATFLPVQWRIEREPDGAAVVWHSDLDPLQRMRGLHGVRLRPGSSLIELDAELHNRTDMPQTFLWWANVAARSHDRYQSFFPDDVAYVADHARRAITAFPRADRPYYGVDYPALADERADADRIDIYSNIPVPSSYMITDTEDEFFGGYDHAADAGFVHWADRAVSPGKKQWTWGDGAIGRAWDDQLTDDDGPYVELMAGVYTDNQPDFSWLLPGETKRFQQYWYPVHATGPARQATTEAAVGVQAEGDATRVTALTTRPRAGAVVVVRRDGAEIARWETDLAPDRPFARRVDVAADTPGLAVEVTHAGELLVAWRSRVGEPTVDEPWLATAPDSPADIPSNDELYVTAVHLLQYRHPSRSALPYLEEALRRDPGDARAATALGAWHVARGQYALARDALLSAQRRQTRRNLNPRDGETAYLLGLVEERLGNDEAADRAWAKAAWNAAFAAPANLARARLALRRGHPERVLRLLPETTSIPEAQRLRAHALAAHDADAARSVLARLADLDPLDPATRALRGDPQWIDARTPLDVGAEFARAGRYDDALAATATPVDRTPAAGAAGPVRRYLRAHWCERAGRPDDALRERRAAREMLSDLAFPAGLDQYDALCAAVVADPRDPVAAGLLGMWLLDAGRHEEALHQLRRATGDGSVDPVVWRNLAIAEVSVTGDEDAAERALAHALQLRADARLVAERDLLAVRRGLAPAERLALLEPHLGLVTDRDDLAVRYATLLLDLGRLDEAWELLTTRRFRPFEGGEGAVIAAYDRAACLLAERLLDVDPAAAVDLLVSGMEPPRSLGEGRHPADRPVRRWVLRGDAHARCDDQEAAAAAWRAAVAPTPLAVDPRPADESVYWAGVAHLRLGDAAAAARSWDALDARAAELRAARDDVDYFATSVPELTPFDVSTTRVRAEQADRLQRLAAEGRALAASAAGGWTRD